MIEIKTPIQKVDKIFHIADVHIRNYKRHKEYRQVFTKLYKFIKKEKTANSIIYVAGDLVHSKNEMSPELVSLLGSFLTELADLCPTLIIMGNHDLNLNNKHRLDALTPVVSAINHPNLHFLSENSYYKFAQIGFSVFEVGTDPSEWHLADGLDTDVKVALHHGAVNRAQTETSIVLKNNEVTLDTFKGFDLGLLGDIHKRQFLDDSKTIAYPGSLIQQNFGEGFEKGILVWDVETLTSQFVQIQNDYEYRTVYVENGKMINWTGNIAKHPRIRIKSTNSSAEQIRAIVKTIKKSRKVEELVVLKDYTVNEEKSVVLSDINIRDVEFQNKLICNYLEDVFSLDDSILDLIRHINRETNTKVTSLDVNKGKIWKPKYFKFSNMFSYGEDNKIDFENLRGLYGIFAPNASGKSTLFDALCFCIFDKCSRTSKGSDVLNIEKEEFNCEFCFESDGELFYIKKRGYKGYSAKAFKDRIKVDVDFYTYDTNGTKVLLNGDQRDSTNKVIQSHIGTYNDFILTALSTQNSSTNFVNKSQRERKELLVRFLDIGIFEELYAIATDASKETSAIIRQLEKKDLENALKEARTVIQSSKESLKELTGVEKGYKSRIKNLDVKVKKLLQKRHNLDEIENLKPLTVLEQDLDSKQKRIVELGSSKEQFILTKESLTKQLYTLHQELETLEELEFKKGILELEELTKQSDKVKNQIDKIDMEISEAKSKINKLEEHEYDPDCEYCVKNPWVKDAHEVRDRYPSLIENRSILYKTYENLNSKISELKKHKLTLETYDKILSDVSKVEAELTSIDSSIKHSSLLKEQAQTSIKFLKKDINLVKRYKKNILENNEIDKELELLNVDIKVLEDKSKEISDDIRRLHGVLESNKTTEKVTLDDIEKLTKTYKEFEAYDFYIKAIKRDGVPYRLVEDILPQVEKEVNKFLDQIVDFKILLNTDGKNVNGYIVYSEETYWPLELGSGMEKFISSLAIRVALINITTLPKSNFIAIDEGFGVLDSTHIGSMERLFTFLETQFLFLFCISHLDVMRDIAPNTIDIGTSNGFSKIDY